MDTNDIVQAHWHSSDHRAEVLASQLCGCFYCLAQFPPENIDEWLDENAGEGQTAVCPHCQIDSVIASESGYPITPEFLEAMRRHWFGP